MLRAKLIMIALSAIFGTFACGGTRSGQYVISESKGYEASLYRQNCAICHGPEGEGKTLDDGTFVPSLRKGDFKMVSEADIYRQIAEGGNGMQPFRSQLTDREIRLLVDLVRNELRRE
jgi:mono/diheme cytochrome c family protein